jgi:nicotinate (nicotinamide) nucleotide adenylyltransferase
MEFFRRAVTRPARLGVLPGTFNPPTRAHLALAQAALLEVDEVLFVLPRVFPHKNYAGATFEQRIEMLRAALADPRCSIAAASRGLFIDIARECRQVYGELERLAFICGRDAAERIVNWDYGTPAAFTEMLETFELLVAARQGEYLPPRHMRRRIHRLRLPRDWSNVSATEIRKRIARGESWEHLVPEAIVGLAREIYREAAPPAAYSL